MKALRREGEGAIRLLLQVATLQGAGDADAGDILVATQPFATLTNRLADLVKSRVGGSKCFVIHKNKIKLLIDNDRLFFASMTPLPLARSLRFSKPYAYRFVGIKTPIAISLYILLYSGLF